MAITRSSPATSSQHLRRETQHSGCVSQLLWMSALVVFEAVEASHVALRLSHRPERSRGFVRTLCPDLGTKEHHMFAIIRRHDGVDQNRTTELTSKVNETL